MDMANENCDPENMRIATQTRQNALKLGAAREKQQVSNSFQLKVLSLVDEYSKIFEITVF